MRLKNLMLPFLGVIYFTLFLTLCQTNGETYTEFITRRLPEVCPYSKFCTTSPLQYFQYNNVHSPCCKPCSCEQDCLERGNCCPDFDVLLNGQSHVDSYISPYIRCAAPIHLDAGHMANMMDGFNMGINWYYIISSCPLEFTDIEVSIKCRTHLNLKEPSDMVAVSDATGRVYSNHFCARCNGVHQFIPWRLKLLQSDVKYSLKAVYDLEQLKDGQFTLVSVPPSLDTALSSRCFYNTFTKCNQTGRWKTFDYNTRQACESSSTYTYVKEHLRYETYKNPFCYICNEEVADVTGICQLDRNEDIRSDFRFPFNAILDLSQVKTEPNNALRQGRLCRLTEMYDPYFDKCRQLNCPLTEMPADGTCVPSFTEVNGLSIYAAIDVDFVDHNLAREFAHLLKFTSGRESHFKHMVLSMEQAIGFDKLSCHACMLKAFLDSQGNVVSFAFGYQTNKQCQPSDIINTLEVWQNTEQRRFTVELNGTEVVFEGNISQSITALPRLADSPLSVRIIDAPGRQELCYPTVFLSHKFYCSHIDLPQQEYLHFRSMNHSHVLDSYFSVADGSNGVDKTYKICVDRYISTEAATDDTARAQCYNLIQLTLVPVAVVFIGMF